MTVRTVFPYPGGKSRVVQQLEQYIPPGCTQMASPFFGGGAFERFCADRHGISVSGADVYEPLVNFWNRLKHDQSRVVQACASRVPRTKADYAGLVNGWHRGEDVDRAACFYNSMRTCFGGVPRGTFVPCHVYRLENGISRELPRVDMTRISVELASFEDFIPRMTDRWMYVDPPYYQKCNLYASPSPDRKFLDHMAFDHELLRETLREHPSWILSYNDHPYVRELYKDCNIVTLKAPYCINRKHNNLELLIMP